MSEMVFKEAKLKGVELKSKRAELEQEGGERAPALVLENPKIVSGTTIAYEVEDLEGYELKKDQQILFIVPEGFRNRIVRDVILKHRKAEKYAVDIGLDKYDPNGAYSLVELHEIPQDQWVSWKDPKGRTPVKFAEPRSSSNPENEILHDWIATVDPLFIDLARVTNVGRSEKYSVVNFHGLEIVFLPNLGDVTFEERIYTPGTEFIDIEKKRLLPKYGGGSHTEGIYENAIVLNQRGKALYQLAKDGGLETRQTGDSLEIKLKPDSELVQVEVSLGDTEHLAEVSPKTKRRTRLGYAKLWVGIKRVETGNTEWFIRDANVPPQGVIAGGPLPKQAKINKGDVLIIQSRNDTSYIMGWRLAYKKSNH